MKMMNLVLVVLSLCATQAHAAVQVKVEGKNAVTLAQLLINGDAPKQVYMDEIKVEARDFFVGFSSRSGLGPFHTPNYGSSLKLDSANSQKLFNTLDSYLMQSGTPGNMALRADAIECVTGVDVISSCVITTNYPVETLN